MALTREEALDEVVLQHKVTELLNVPSVRDALHDYLEDEVEETVERSKAYNHLFFIGFSVNTDVSAEELAADNAVQIPIEELKAAVMRRVEDLFKPKYLPDGVWYEIYEAIGLPEDTYENQEF